MNRAAEWTRPILCTALWVTTLSFVVGCVCEYDDSCSDGSCSNNTVLIQFYSGTQDGCRRTGVNRLRPGKDALVGALAYWWETLFRQKRARVCEWVNGWMCAVRLGAVCVWRDAGETDEILQEHLFRLFLFLLQRRVICSAIFISELKPCGNNRDCISSGRYTPASGKHIKSSTWFSGFERVSKTTSENVGVVFWLCV